MTANQTSRIIDEAARHVAEDLGRDWSDCGEYERMAFRDEAGRRMESRLRYVSCDRCGGAGEIEVRPIVGPYEDPTACAVPCSACDGCGMECVDTDDAD